MACRVCGVLAAVTVGSGAFGVLGMLLGVPVCSVVYALVQDCIAPTSRSERRPEEAAADMTEAAPEGRLQTIKKPAIASQCAP